MQYPDNKIYLAVNLQLKLFRDLSNYCKTGPMAHTILKKKIMTQNKVIGQMKKKLWGTYLLSQPRMGHMGQKELF